MIHPLVKKVLNDTFTWAYIDCALWASNDESDERGGRPLNENYGIDGFAEEALAKMIADCEKFKEENRTDIEDGLGYNAAGYDFWLTRCGHGCGFWDGDWPEEIGERLTEASNKFGKCDIYVGDDGLLYVSPS